MIRCNTRNSCSRRGITLIEMLIAIAISLVVLLAVVSIFDQLNSAMTNSKAAIEQAGELRNVTQRLQADLDGRTALTLSWTPADAGDGYFEYIEGNEKDSTAVATATGDRDDILMFTARSTGKPFVGLNNGAVIESELAEIIWVVKTPTAAKPEDVTVHRIVRLIRPDLTPAGTHTISVNANGPNTLADLVLRENRYQHANGFPHAANVAAIRGDAVATNLVLNKVVAFDVRVYDPMAPLRGGTGVALAPGDSGWAAAATVIGRGAYVDLNYAGNSTTSFFSGPPNAKSQLTVPTYSTWPEAYEHDGDNQDGDADTDEGRDGFDTPPGPTAADDPSETETFPPYPHPITGQKFPGLRGVQVRIRLIEPGSRQVRQATVVSDFVPE